MEGFEQVVKLYLESKGFVVSGNAKFPHSQRITKKDGRVENQTHGFEVDIVAARRDKLVLGFVKSYFGSIGVSRQGFDAIADPTKKSDSKLYRVFNDSAVRNSVINGASEKFGYATSEIQLALFVGKFKERDREAICDYLGNCHYGGSPVWVVDVNEIISDILNGLTHTYSDNPIIAVLKALKHVGRLTQ